MATLGIKEAFERYGARLRNVQWSVSAWNAGGELVVSLWEHHHRKGPPGTMEFADTVDRWSGPGNTEFRKNLQLAKERKARARLVIVRTDEPARVQAGEDASRIKKDFHLRPDLVGEVVSFDGRDYVIRFSRALP